MLEQLARLEQTNELYEEFRIPCRLKWVEAWGFTAKDKLGNVTALVGTTKDITERRHAEEALRRNEELLRAAFDQVAVGFSMTDLEGRLLKVNEAYCRITGYTQRLLNGEIKSIVYPKRYIRKTGESVWVQNSTSALSDGHGKVAGFVVLTEDITERKKAEEGLQELSGRLLQLQDEERRKIARDLHHEAGQNLVALSSTLGHLHGAIPSAGRRLRKDILQCQELVDVCIREVRTMSYILHPLMLDEVGLEDQRDWKVVGEARGGREAIEMVKKLKPDIAIVDITMPDMDGLEVTRRIRDAGVKLKY